MWFKQILWRKTTFYISWCLMMLHLDLNQLDWLRPRCIHSSQLTGGSSTSLGLAARCAKASGGWEIGGSRCLQAKGVGAGWASEDWDELRSIELNVLLLWKSEFGFADCRQHSLYAVATLLPLALACFCISNYLVIWSSFLLAVTS